MLSGSKMVERRVVRELEKHFDKSIDIKSRVRVVSDLYKFNYKEDQHVWSQKRGKIAPYFAVYFDDEFVMGFTTEWSIEMFLYEFWQNLKKLIKEDKIVLNKIMSIQKKHREEVIKKDKQKKEANRVKNLPETTEVERLSKEVVKRVSKPRKKRASASSARPDTRGV